VLRPARLRVRGGHWDDRGALPLGGGAAHDRNRHDEHLRARGLAIVAVVGIGIVNRIRGRDKDDWRDGAKPGDGPKLTPGNYPAPPWG
jgi:hypothetical protein